MKYVIPLVTLLLTTGSQAQDEAPIVDITLSDNGRGQIEMRVRTDGHFDLIPSALTFTVRWPAAAGMALDTAVRCYPFQDVLPMSAVHPVTSGTYTYRTFNGFGTSTLADFGQSWEPGHEYPICTADILVPGTAFEVVNDPWTNANNRDFYVSLGGVDRTGIVFQSPEPTVAVHALNQGTGNIDVVLTPDADFFGWVTDLDFSVRWPQGSGASLGAITQTEEVSEYLSVQKVGAPVNAGGFTYQRFHGEGLKSIANSADAWHAGQEVIALSVPLFGDAPGITVMNDDWTAANAGDYAIVLNGHDRTGPIDGLALGIPAAAPDDIRATVFPTAHGFDLMVDLPDNARTASFRLFNAAGQLIWNTTRERAQGRTNLTAATGPIPDGLYILSVRHGERSVTRRVIR